MEDLLYLFVLVICLSPISPPIADQDDLTIQVIGCDWAETEMEGKPYQRRKPKSFTHNPDRLTSPSLKPDILEPTQAEAYLRKENRRLVYYLSNLLRKNRPLPQGMSLDEDQLTVRGKDLPNLIPLDCLLIPFVNDIQHHPKVEAALLDAGLSVKELEALTFRISGPQSRKAFLDRHLAFAAEMAQTFRARGSISDQEVKRYVYFFRALRVQAGKAWAAHLLEPLSVPSRRALIHVLKKGYTPISVNYFYLNRLSPEAVAHNRKKLEEAE